MHRLFPIRVFVYGTLKPGGHYWSRFCEGKVTAAEPASVRGQLYDLPMGYPALVLGGQERVQGYVLTLRESVVLAGFDYLEGYSEKRLPSANEYQRVRVDAFRPGGEYLGEVWSYCMEQARVTALGGTLLVSGSWPHSP